MNEKTSQLSISEMRLHLFNRIESLVEINNIADADALAKEWIIDGMNPDNDSDYIFLVDCYYKKVRGNSTRKYDELDF